MIAQVLSNMGLKTNGDYSETDILKAVIPPITFYDYAFNYLQHMKLSEQSFNNYQRNLYLKSRKNSGRFGKIIFRGVEYEYQNILCSHFDSFEDYIKNDVAILRNCFYTLFHSIKDDKRQVITDLFLIYVLTDISITIFEKFCGGKRFPQLTEFYDALKKLIDNLSMKYGTKKEIIDVSTDKNVTDAINIIINKIQNYKITS